MSHTPGPLSVMEDLELYDFIVQLKICSPLLRKERHHDRLPCAISGLYRHDYEIF